MAGFPRTAGVPPASVPVIQPRPNFSHARPAGRRRSAANSSTTRRPGLLAYGTRPVEPLDRPARPSEPRPHGPEPDALHLPDPPAAPHVRARRDARGAGDHGPPLRIPEGAGRARSAP